MTTRPSWPTFQAKGRDGLLSALRRQSWAHILRNALEPVARVDRPLFRKLARNQTPPRVRAVKHHGFVEIAGILAEDWRDLHRAVAAAPDAFADEDREAMFWRAIDMVHRVSKQYRVYIGRTFLRAGATGLADRAAWHRERLGAKWLKPLGVVPRSRVERDEILGISLVKLWEGFDVLCCDNSVVDSRGKLTDDPRQLLYLYLRPRS